MSSLSINYLTFIIRALIGIIMSDSKILAISLLNIIYKVVAVQPRVFRIRLKIQSMFFLVNRD